MNENVFSFQKLCDQVFTSAPMFSRSLSFTDALLPWSASVCRRLKPRLQRQTLFIGHHSPPSPADAIILHTPKLCRCTSAWSIHVISCVCAKFLTRRTLS